MSTSTALTSNSGPGSMSSQRIHAITNFLAADSSIVIVPSFNYKSTLTFLVSQSSVGPFYAGVSTVVPLWMGIYLRKRNLCRLVAPDWMGVEHLRSVLEFETDPSKESFSDKLPFRYKEISRSILQACGAGRSYAHTASDEEIPEAEKVRVLLEDISTIRMDKIRKNVHKLSSVNMRSTKPLIINVTGIGSAEINVIRPFLETAFRAHLSLVSAGSSSRKSEKNVEETADGNEPTSGTTARSRIRRFR